MDEFDRVADLEGEIYRRGFDNGAKVGRSEGLVEGEQMGWSKGFALASEVGFYLGVLDMLFSIAGASEATQVSSSASETSANSGLEAKDACFMSAKTRKSLESLKSMALLLDENGVLKMEVMEQLHTIRSKFKLVCAQLGLKLRYTGTTIDKVAETELPAGIPSVDF